MPPPPPMTDGSKKPMSDRVKTMKMHLAPNGVKWHSESHTLTIFLLNIPIYRYTKIHFVNFF